jgi:hypothetical protein
VSRRPSLEERIAQRQRERGPLKEGKYFEHRTAAIAFAGVLVCVVLTHIVAFVMIEYLPK